MSKHTSGPWRLVTTTTPGQFVREHRIRSEDDSMICEIGPVSQEANARLIAAAPEMLEALRLAIEQLEPVTKPKLIQLPEYALRAVKDAIAKAEGRS